MNMWENMFRKKLEVTAYKENTSGKTCFQMKTCMVLLKWTTRGTSQIWWLDKLPPQTSPRESIQEGLYVPTIHRYGSVVIPAAIPNGEILRKQKKTHDSAECLHTQEQGWKSSLFHLVSYPPLVPLRHLSIFLHIYHNMSYILQ